MDPVVSVQTKNFSQTQRSLQKFLEPNRKPKVIYIDNSLKFGKSCKEFILESLDVDTTQIGNKCIAQSERRYICSIGCNQVWMKIGWQIPWNALSICETFKISCLMGGLHKKDVVGNHLKDRLFHLVHWLSISNLCKRPVKNLAIWKESLTWIVPWRTLCTRGRNLEG